MRKTLAVFFQKHNNIFFKFLKKIYCRFFLVTNKYKIQYLREAGAVIGEGCIIHTIESLGSEPYLVQIGDNVSFAGDVSIVTHDGATARLYYMGLTNKKYDHFGCVKIGSNCFIGKKTVILKDVTIGDNCIIGAFSLVTKSIPPNSIACGVPAKVISSVDKYFQKNQQFFENTVEMNEYEKRLYIEQRIELYQKKRIQKNSNINI